MYGGEISNNTAGNGGGVYVDGYFSMLGGMIANNTAIYDGGGVYVSGGHFDLLGGKISGNVAFGNGGGVWVTDTNDVSIFARLFIGESVVFEANSASLLYSRAGVYDDVYDAQIKCTHWSSPFVQGYNNFDISYTYGVPVVFYSVSVSGSYAAQTGVGSYEAGDFVTVSAGSRDGYTFSSWTVNEGGITLYSSPTVTFVMPSRNVVLTAVWSANTPTPDGGGGGGSSSKPSPSPSSPNTPAPSEPEPSTTAPGPSSNVDEGTGHEGLSFESVLIGVAIGAVLVSCVGVGVVFYFKKSVSQLRHN